MHRSPSARNGGERADRRDAGSAREGRRDDGTLVDPGRGRVAFVEASYYPEEAEAEADSSEEVVQEVPAAAPSSTRTCRVCPQRSAGIISSLTSSCTRRPRTCLWRRAHIELGASGSDRGVAGSPAGAAAAATPEQPVQNGHDRGEPDLVWAAL